MQQDDPIGKIEWVDLTVEDADRVRDFYAAVAGWKPQPVAMGEYNDYNMTLPGSGAPTAGICHKRGINAELPSQWMIYISVADLDKSVQACQELGGKVLVGPKGLSADARYCIIQDPAGAVCALFWKRQ